MNEPGLTESKALVIVPAQRDAYLISWKKNGASPRRRNGIRSSGDLASIKNVGEVLVTIDAS